MHSNLHKETCKHGDYTDLQYYYDLCLPGNSTVLNSFDAVTMRVRDIALNSADVRLTLSKADPVPQLEKEKGVEYLVPLLRTSVEKPRTPGLIENWIAMVKRNFDCPELTGDVDIEYLSTKVVDRFFEVFVTKDRISPDAYTGSSTSVLDWLAKQLPTTLGQLANIKVMGAVNEYKHMIKRQAKAKLDNSILSEYPALQTIVYHSKDINAIFGPIFDDLTGRLLECIDSERFLFYTRKTPEDVQSFFSNLTLNQELDVYELDISKYDKSQNEFHCAIEMKIWERLGFDHYLKSIWEKGHKLTTITDYTAGIKTAVWYQRKSGDVTTFIGNTVIIACCLASIMPLESCFKAAFCGDDSIVYLPKGTPCGEIHSGASLLWNFSAKLYKRVHGYFCGRYVVRHPKGCIVYPDPLKLITKLGNKSIKDYDHLEEFRISLFDVFKPLTNDCYFSFLDDAIREVYPQACSCSFVLCALYKYLSDPFSFRNIFLCGVDFHGSSRTKGKERIMSKRLHQGEVRGQSPP